MFKINYNSGNDGCATSDSGILYMLLIILDDGTQFIKIGITSRSIASRTLEILGSFFQVYRYFPYVKPIRFTNVADYKAKELELHKFLSYCSYTPDYRFDGSTELFSLQVDEAKDLYKHINKEGNLKGYVKNNKD